MTQQKTVQLLDVRRQTAVVRNELDAAIARVLDHSQFVLGPEVAELENAIANYCDTRFAVACASGSDALLLPLSVLGTGPGCSVITTPFTFFASAGSIARLGAAPIFAEIEPDTFNLSPEWLKRYLADCSAAKVKSIKAIVAVHLFGLSAEMDAINATARDYDIPVIEDAAQAIGAEYNGRRVGSLGWCAAFSFFPSKNLGGLGDGGIITTDDERLAEQLRVWRTHGAVGGYQHKYVGMNSRLDTLQAAALLVKLRYLDSWTDIRRKNALSYCLKLHADDRVVLPTEPTGLRHVYNQFTVRVPDRDQVRSRLLAAGIGCAIYYPVPLHLQECFTNLGYRAGDFPVAESASKAVLSLPIESGISDGDVETVSHQLQLALTRP